MEAKKQQQTKVRKTVTKKQVEFAYDLINRVGMRCYNNLDLASQEDLAVLLDIVEGMEFTIGEAEWQYRLSQWKKEIARG